MKRHLVGCGVQLVQLVCFLDYRVMMRLKFVKITRYIFYLSPNLGHYSVTAAKT